MHFCALVQGTIRKKLLRAEKVGVVVGLAGDLVKAPGDRSIDTSKLVSIEVPKMNVKNPRLKVRKPVFTLIRTDNV